MAFAVNVIQTGPNHLNHYYRWPAVVVIQMVWPGLYFFYLAVGCSAGQVCIEKGCVDF